MKRRFWCPVEAKRELVAEVLLGYRSLLKKRIRKP